MKPQDIFFVVLFLLVLLKKDSRVSMAIGIVCILLSIPLFSFWVFFTAERLTWYGAAFFLLTTVLQLKEVQKQRK